MPKSVRETIGNIAYVAIITLLIIAVVAVISFAIATKETETVVVSQGVITHLDLIRNPHTSQLEYKAAINAEFNPCDGTYNITAAEYAAHTEGDIVTLVKNVESCCFGEVSYSYSIKF